MERTDGSFTDAEPMAVEFVNCEIPQWSEKRTRVRSRTFDADAGLWRTYSLSFMPRYDGDFRIFLMGSRGRMTAFDEISAEGAQVVNGSFETDEGWSLGVLESARAMNEPEHAVRGIVEGGPVFPAAQGRRVAVVNHDFTLSQTVRLKKGVRFILTWKARAWNSVKTKAK